MNKRDLLHMAIKNLTRRKSRTLLTVLGILIGTISITMMMALGIGMKENFNAQLEGMTTLNIIEVYKNNNYYGSSKTRLAEQEQIDKISDMDIDFFRTIEGVEVVTPVLQTSAKIVAGRYENYINIMGLLPETMDALGYELEQGELLEENDEPNKIKIIFGNSVPEQFSEISSSSGGSYSSGRGMGGGGMRIAMGGGYPGSDTDISSDWPIDIYSERMRLSLDSSYSPFSSNSSNADIYPLYTAGVLEAGDISRDRFAYMDINVLKEMQEDYYNDRGIDMEEGYDTAYVKVENMEDSETVIAVLENYGFQAYSPATYLESMESTMSMFQVALGAIGAIALLVAGIGITNTMIMAIHERKREIGIMKVIGATLKDIKNLFLLEAAAIGFLGGIIGIGISVLAAHYLSSESFNMMAGGRMGTVFAFSIPQWLILSGMAFTTVLGIVAGYLPARKAMKSSALEALRTE